MRRETEHIQRAGLIQLGANGRLAGANQVSKIFSASLDFSTRQIVRTYFHG